MQCYCQTYGFPLLIPNTGLDYLKSLLTVRPKDNFLPNLLNQTDKLRKTENIDSELLKAAELLYNDYIKDKELTAFTSLDSENFYEEG